MSKSCIWNHLATLKVLGLCKHIHTLCVCVNCMYVHMRVSLCSSPWQVEMYSCVFVHSLLLNRRALVYPRSPMSSVRGVGHWTRRLRTASTATVCGSLVSACTGSYCNRCSCWKWRSPISTHSCLLAALCH